MAIKGGVTYTQLSAAQAAAIAAAAADATTKANAAAAAAIAAAAADATTKANAAQAAAAADATTKANAAQAAGFGVGQLFQDVTASRAIGTTYTNSSGKPIIVIAVCNSAYTVGGALVCPYVAGSTGGAINVNESNGASYQGHPSNVIFVVPAGSQYAITLSAGSATLSKWMELR